ncbi:MAG TPA: tetratricopeptide repeat protein [Bacteroidetes bacterium]|nr:tetratricopeptide repeat protein [Bacteroidota bacterium]
MKKLFLHVIILSFFFTFPAGAQDVTRNIMQFQIGQRYEYVGDYRNALEIYLALHKRNPRNYTYFDAVTRCLANLKKFDQLLSFIQQQIDQNPQNLQYRVKFGTALLQKGEEKNAEQYWNELLARNRKNSSLYRMIAQAWMMNRKFDKGVEIYNRGRRELGKDSLFALELAQLHTYQLNYDLAAEEYLKFVRQNPNRLSYVSARFASFKGDFQTYEQVTSVLQRWIKREPEVISYRKLFADFLISFANYSDAFSQVEQIERLRQEQKAKEKPGAELFRFGKTMDAEKQYSLAEKSFTLVLEKYASFVNRSQVEYELARSVYLQKKFKQALQQFDLVSRKFPKSNWSLEAQLTRGDIFLHQLFMPDSAAGVFKKILRLFPKNDKRTLALIALGDVEVVRQNLTAAENYYNQALHVTVRNTGLKTELRIKCNLKLAEVAFFKKNFDQAQKYLNAILQNNRRNLSNVFINDALELLLLIDENAAQYHDALGRYADALLLLRQKQLKRAAHEFESILQTDPDAPLTPKSLLKSAQLKEDLGDYLSAVMVYQKILARYPENSLCDLSLWNMGQLYENKIRDVSKAIENYEQILYKYPDSILTDKARKRIRELEGKS